MTGMDAPGHSPVDELSPTPSSEAAFKRWYGPWSKRQNERMRDPEWQKEQAKRHRLAAKQKRLAAQQERLAAQAKKISSKKTEKETMEDASSSAYEPSDDSSDGDSYEEKEGEMEKIIRKSKRKNGKQKKKKGKKKNRKKKKELKILKEKETTPTQQEEEATGHTPQQPPQPPPQPSSPSPKPDPMETDTPTPKKLSEKIDELAKSLERPTKKRQSRPDSVFVAPVSGFEIFFFFESCVAKKLARGSNPPRLRNGRIYLAKRTFKKSFAAVGEIPRIAPSGVPRKGFWVMKNFIQRPPTPVSCSF